MLVTLALTSVLVTFSYMGLSSMQKLLVDYKKQNSFISQLNELNSRLNYLFTKATLITKANERDFVFKTDSIESKIMFNESYVLTIKDNMTDTFRLEAKALKITSEEMHENATTSFVKSLEFDIYFQKQKFHLTFNKNYDAYSIIQFITDIEH